MKTFSPYNVGPVSTCFSLVFLYVISRSDSGGLKQNLSHLSYVKIIDILWKRSGFCRSDSCQCRQRIRAQ